MKGRARADRNYKFTKKKHSGAGVLAFLCSFVPLLLFFYAVSVSFFMDGRAPEKIGCIGTAAVIFAVLTFYVSVREARKENIIKRVPIAGAVLSVLMLAGWTTVYVLGWM